MKNQNKGYERRAIRKLNKINRDLKGLSNQVNEELYSSKREHQDLVEQGRKLIEEKKKNKMIQALQAKIEQEQGQDQKLQQLIADENVEN